ncbi:MAG TPA: efflux RND transporter permease subunit, partial [Usitatibacter sp.]|nr:efflux RND transporter permease subunit [Usitatibacter sp.]
VLTFAIAVVLQWKVGGSTFLPPSDYGTIAIDVRTPSSASLDYARLKVEKAAELARTIPETVATNSTVYAGGGRVYVDIGKSNKRRRGHIEIAAELRTLLARLVGAEYVVIEDLNQGVRKPVQIQFMGPDSRRLMAITGDFMDRMKAIPGAVDVGLSEQEPKDELKIELDRGLANSLGISVNDAAQSLRVAFAGVEVGDWIDPTGETRDVSVRLAPEDRVDASNIEHLPIAVGGSNMMVPLDQIATITMGKGPAQIQHLDGKRMVAVSANTQGRASGEVTADAMKIAKSIEFPPGYGITLGGASRDQQEVFSEMFIALIMGIALMYLVLVMQFGSFTAPLPVMLSLPLSLIGVVLALLLARKPMGFVAILGIIALVGMIVRNSVILVDQIETEIAHGRSRWEAVIEATSHRFRPILLTAAAAIFGMVPIAPTVFWGPMAYAIMGGLAVATLLTLVFLPALYVAWFRIREHEPAPLSTASP